MKSRLVLAIALVSATASLSAATLTIDTASLSFDPNAMHWYVSSKVCNSSSSGFSGSLLYELRLLRGDKYWSIGSEKSQNTLDHNKCRTYDKLNIQVNPKKVPIGEYQIQFVVSEWDGQRYVIRDTTTFNKTFVRGGGQ